MLSAACLCVQGGEEMDLPFVSPVVLLPAEREAV